MRGGLIGGRRSIFEMKHSSNELCEASEAAEDKGREPKEFKDVQMESIAKMETFGKAIGVLRKVGYSPTP